MTAIKTNKLCKFYGDVKAVDCLDLEINEGEIFALLGQNGAGKTTLIKMLIGLTKPTSGEIIVLDKNIKAQYDEIRPYIAVSPQETSVAAKLTVAENLKFIAGIYGINAADVDGMIAKMHLADKKDTLASRLSGGQQRRLSIAMALITEPKILFLDEPTLGVDVMARRGLQEIVKSLRGRVTVVLTTHYLEEAEDLADRIAVMSKGVIKALGTPNELMQSTGTASVEEAFIALVGKESDWE